MTPNDDEFGEPVGYIECNGELMAFWLPEDVSVEELDIEWVAP